MGVVAFGGSSHAEGECYQGGICIGLMHKACNFHLCVFTCVIRILMDGCGQTTEQDPQTSTTTPTQKAVLTQLFLSITSVALPASLLNLNL